MTAGLLATMRLQQEAREASVVARLVEQKLEAVKNRAEVNVSDLCEREDMLSRSIFDARHALLMAASNLDRVLAKCDQSG